MRRIDEDIKSGNFSNIYLLYGSEDYLKRQYRDKLVKALVTPDDTMNFAKFEGKETEVDAVIELADTLPFFADRRVLVLKDTGFFHTSQDVLADYLTRVPESTVLIFVEQEVKKTVKSFKAANKAGKAIEFAILNADTLKKWVGSRVKQAGKTMTEDAWIEFYERTNNSMENMDKELEKLLSYTMDEEAITREDVDAIVVKQLQSKVFDMIGAMSSKNVNQMLALYHDLMLDSKQDPVGLLSLIAGQFQQMYVIKDLASQGMNVGQIASRMGVQDFIVRKNYGYARNYSMEQIRNLLEDAADCIEQSTTGRMNGRMAVELLMVKYAK